MFLIKIITHVQDNTSVEIDDTEHISTDLIETNVDIDFDRD